MFQPRNWSFVAKTSCDQPFFMRRFFTCAPIKFFGMSVTGTDVKANMAKICVHTHTADAKI